MEERRTNREIKETSAYVDVPCHGVEKRRSRAVQSVPRSRNEGSSRDGLRHSDSRIP